MIGIQDLANNIKKFAKLEDETYGIFKEIDNKNHLVNTLALMPFMALTGYLVYFFSSGANLPLFLLSSFCCMAFVICFFGTMIEKNFFTNSIVNKIKGYFYKKNKNKNKNPNILLRKIIQNNCQINVKSEAVINDYFNKLSRVKKEILNVGVISDTGFQMYNFNIVEYIDEYIKNNESKILKENKDSIFKVNCSSHAICKPTIIKYL